jgi:hypothetical protein
MDITGRTEIRYINRHSVMVSSQGKENKGARGSAHINPVYSYISTSPRRSEESVSCAVLVGTGVQTGHRTDKEGGSVRISRGRKVCWLAGRERVGRR